MKAKKLILDYCKTMLPGFETDWDNNTASQQNSYLSNQIIPVVDFFKQIESQDFLMFSLDWLTNNKKEAVTIETLKPLENFGVSGVAFMHAYSEPILDLTGSMTMTIHKFNFKNQFFKSEAYNDSWLCDDAFKSIMTSKLMTLKYDKFYFSDFLHSVSKIINTEKKKQYIGLLSNIKHNYESCVEYSKDLCNLSM